MKFRFAVFAVLTVALGACADTTRWEHPQTGIAALDVDLAQCNREARNRSADTSLAAAGGFGSTTGPARMTREGGGVPMADETFGSTPRRDPQQDESRLAYDCMQAKGYRPVPVAKDAAKS